MACICGTPEVRCNCTNEKCPRHGNCCECIVRHRERGELPACYFPPEAERLYDRSIAHFIRIQKQ